MIFRCRLRRQVRRSELPERSSIEGRGGSELGKVGGRVIRKQGQGSGTGMLNLKERQCLTIFSGG